jgi:hypothetical protein
MVTKKNESSLGGLVVLIVLALIVWFILPDRWTDPLWYSVKYSVNTDQVHWNARPTECDWGHAPLGDKGCQFKKTVNAFNAVGEVVGGDDAPKYGNDTKTGKPIISYDKGKTWAWLPVDAPAAPDLRIKRIEIDWAKVTD